MTPNVDPAELEALLGAGRADSAAGADVQVRDFGAPQRLSFEQREMLSRELKVDLKNLEKELKPVLREAHRFELVGIREASAQGLFDELQTPMAIGRFAVLGQVGWIQWEVVAALRTIELVLGASEPQDVAARALSPVERKVLLRIFAAFATAVGRRFGLEVEGLSVVDQLERLGTWHEGKPTPDPQRTQVSVAIDGPTGASTLNVYVPGVRRLDAGAAAKPPVKVPSHLANVEVALSARLGATDIPLSQLLALEVGDVIPLDADVGGTLVLWAEERPFARARLGAKDGTLAVRVAEFVEPELGD